MSNANTNPTPYDARIAELRPRASHPDGWESREIAHLETMRGFYHDPQSMVGQPATYRIGSDCYPLVVVKISKSGAKIWLAKVEATRTDSNGMSECQDYTYDIEGALQHAFANGNGRITYWAIATRRKLGSYAIKGRGAYACVTIGHARRYRDPSF